MLLAAAAWGHAQAKPGEGAAPEWIRPEEVFTRADGLLRQLEAARPGAAVAAALEEIETRLPELGRDLDAGLQRAAAAAERSASPAEREDVRRALTQVAAPLRGWKDQLAAEGPRVAAMLDQIAHGERVWSKTRERAETAAAGDVVLRRVDGAIEALIEAAASLRTWRARVLAASDRVLERVAAVDAALEKLRVAAGAERTTLLVPDRAPLWSRGFGAELRNELSRVPGEILAFAESTVAYGARDAGGILAFTLTLLAALLLAQVVTRVLEEDVYPRTRLPRGVPYALSTLVRYGFYSLGLLFALAAAGVQLGQVAIMLGGFGVGIGLGLQDLVKNFAAGLTLLFERRVHVGNALEMPSQGIFGRVLSIGMRASVVRTWNGAEVVVPTADLISSAVTNWTLSDRLCRIEMPVGVAYGTDPERVVALLLHAARSNDRLLEEPAPQALFKGFGESSLDFVVRARTDEGYEQALPLTSELGLAVHRALRDAGITIPFPQRDLHLARVSPAARAALPDVD